MTNVPVDLDQPCGEHFVYRDLIECGETWRRLASTGALARPLDNIPKRTETFAAIRLVCETVLDPVVNHFGRLELTYGFASSSLTKHIDGRIAPELDQHAGYELNRAGKPICSRLGLAVDFMVPSIDSREIARWLIERSVIDRLYFYESDRPLHVSVGPENVCQVVHMRRGPSGRRVPRVVGPDFFR